MLKRGLRRGLSDQHLRRTEMEAVKAPPATTPVVVAPADMTVPQLARAIIDKVTLITSSLRTSVACADPTFLPPLVSKAMARCLRPERKTSLGWTR
jgi:hypothetical protein